MKVEVLTKDNNEKVPVWWSIASSIPGCIALSGAVGMLLNIARSFAADTKYTSLIINWVPWIAVLFFVVGWFMAHGIEINLLQKQFRAARIWVFSFLVGIVVIPLALVDLVTHPVFHKLLDYVFFPLVMSGYFFRWSIFHKESLRLLPSIIFGEKLESQ